MPEVRPGPLPGLLLLAPKVFTDARGSFSETWQQDDFRAAGIEVDFIQDNQVGSVRAGTLRGLHFQRRPAAQSKLVRVLRGAIFDVAVDLRPGSASYGRWGAVELSAENRLQFFVPAGFAHGYLTLTDHCEVLYKVDAPYAPALEAGIRWDDPGLGIAWPSLAQPPLLAPRDATLPLLADLGAERREPGP
jgi:dTDP-4-dehydrorhamnose 3,5-epimerase